MKAIIGGTGIDEVNSNLELKEITTQYGKVQYFKDGEIIFILRHGSSHSLPPHLINYKANIEALSLLNVDECISIYCVGSISTLCPPSEISLVDDLIDFTSRENKTFSTEGNVIHTNMQEIFDTNLQDRIIKNSKKIGLNFPKKGIYICTEGPRFETKAEIRMYKQWGADYVGMTGCPEIPLIREKQIKIASIAYSINWCSGINSDSEFTLIENKEMISLAKKIVEISKISLL